MGKIIRRCICVLLLGCIPVSTAAQESPNSLRVMYLAQSGYHPDDVQMLTRMFKELSGIEVSIDYVTYSDVTEKIAEQVSQYDIIALDHIWVAELASRKMIIPLDSYLSKKVKSDLEPAVLHAFQYNGNTWAFPFLINMQLLFYNQQMLEKAGFEEPAATLDDLVQQMKVLKEEGIVEYPWTDSWKKSEGLIFEFVWLTGAFGGKLFDRNREPIFDQEPGVNALAFMIMLLKEQLANPNILSYDEIAAANDFILGQAAFTSNWLFQTGLLNDPQISEIVEAGSMTILPVSRQASQKTVSSGAFQGLAISAQSPQKELAWKWLAFFTSPLVQRAFLFEMPIWESVQSSKDANMLDPTMSMKQTQLENTFYRPNIPRYVEISPILQHYIHIALEGKMEPVDALSKARTEIETLLKGTQ